MITLCELETMKRNSEQPITKETLTDIRDVNINENLPLFERALDFINQIKNPYVFRYKDTVVRINFPQTNISFEDRMKSYFEML